MARKPVTTFSLSFLDCMCCGFGAIILVFILIIHRVSETAEAVTENLRADTARQELRVDVLTAALDDETTTLQQVDAQLAQLDDEIARLRSLLEQAAIKKQEEPPATPDPLEKRPRRPIGRAHEVQLIGLSMSGRRSLILVDSSASMLDSSIVGIVRRRHRPTAEKKRAPKWQQALAAVDWLAEHLPAGGKFQLYTFDTTAGAVIDGTDGQWLDAGDTEVIERARAALRTVIPTGGTSLHAAMRAAATMRPRPDSIYLLIDGLPTVGSGRTYRTTVTGRERLKLFRDALQRLPRGIAVNVLLYPLEGDPSAAAAYWDLAIATNGSFLSPSEEWP